MICRISGFTRFVLQRKPGSPQVQFIKNLGQGDQAFIHKVQVGKSFYAAKICLLDTPVKTIHEAIKIIALTHPNIITVHHALPMGFLMYPCETDLYSFVETHRLLPPGVLQQFPN